MKRGMVLSFSLFFLVMAYSISLAEEIYIEGEGYVEPTAASQEPLNLSNIKSSQGIFAAVGDQVTVNVQANNFPVINLYTTVRSQNGIPVTGLNAGDFDVTEDGVTETIKNVTESTGSCSGITVCLVFDVSGSMEWQPLIDAQTAAINFVNSCDPQNDRIGLVSFSDSNLVNLVMPVRFIYTDDNNNGVFDIIDAINGLVAYGGTAVYNGTQKGILSLIQEPQPKAIIGFSDGATWDDTITINDVINSANNYSIPLYMCGFYYDSKNLEDMADQTGGLYRFAPSASDMRDFYNDIAGGLCSNYIISYTSHNPAYDGSTRIVSVTHDGGTTFGYGFYVVNYRPVITRDTATINLSNMSQAPDTDLNICGNVQDNDAEAQGQQLIATLYYRHINETSFTSTFITLMKQGSGTYSFCATIPGATVQEPGIQYYLHVTDGIQENYSPFNYDFTPYSIPVQPNHAPTITHTPVTNALSNQVVTITAVVVDNDQGDCVSRVALFYRTHDINQITPYHILEMANTSGNTYTADIPAGAVVQPGIDYFIAAWDSYIVRSDHGTSGVPHFIQIAHDSCTIHLVPGWNIIGYCGQTSQSVSSALQTINGLYYSVWSYESGSWKVYDPQYPEYSDLSVLEPCRGYWIEMNSSGTLTLR